MKRNLEGDRFVLLPFMYLNRQLIYGLGRPVFALVMSNHNTYRPIQIS